MKIVYLAAGAANMFCGSCLHDNTLAAALLDAGHDVLLVPTYTPLRTDEDNVSQERVFFGGINVYLQQKSALFRHTPWMLDALLDRPNLIRLAMELGPGVAAEKLGDLTVSMLQGEAGHQKKELDKLVRWLADEARPDVVHLSNAMLMGMAREIRALGIPVVCSLSGEDIFLERLPEPFYSQARRELRERAAEIDAFIALNGYYADFMADYLVVGRQRIDVIPHGLKLDGHAANPRTRAADPAAAEITIGSLARISPDKGTHLLVSAFEQLLADPTLPPLKLRLAGYLGHGDRAYFAELEKRVAAWPTPDRFEYVGEVSRDEKIAFLQSIDIFSLPTVYPESKGLPVLEAWANGLPAVLPDHGTFPELAADTGAALLHAPGDPAGIAGAIKHLVGDLELAATLGRQGHAAVRDRYHAAAMAQRTAALYQRLLDGRQADQAPVAPAEPTVTASQLNF